MADAGAVLASAPIGDIIRDMAMAIADAQARLDDAGIRTAKRMADTIALQRGSGEDAESFSLLALGFTPTFYNFVEADLELRLETRITEDTSIGVTAGGSFESTSETPSAGGTDTQPAETDTDPAGGEGGGTPAAGGGAATPQRSSTRAVGMTMSAEFQRKFSVETSGHTRIAAKLVALPPPARFLEVLTGGAG